MTEKKTAILYNCTNCQINFKGKKCVKCGRPGKPVYPKDIQPARDWKNDYSYLEYIEKKKREEKNN